MKKPKNVEPIEETKAEEPVKSPEPIGFHHWYIDQNPDCIKGMREVAHNEKMRFYVPE